MMGTRQKSKELFLHWQWVRNMDISNVYSKQSGRRGRLIFTMGNGGVVSELFDELQTQQYQRLVIPIQISQKGLLSSKRSANTN